MSMMPCTPVTPDLASRCRLLIYEVAEKHEIAPVLITAHCRAIAADEARKEVWRRMITELHLRRGQVASMFGRDLRRLRRSVIGV